MAEQLYSKEDVADRIEAVLGQRPNDNVLWLTRRHQGRPVRLGSKSLVAGMPTWQMHDGVRVWVAEEVEAWLANHPILRLQAARAQFAKTYTHGLETNSWARQAQAVRAAQDEGLSWAQLAEVIGEVTGEPISRQAVAARYGPHRDLSRAQG